MNWLRGLADPKNRTKIVCVGTLFYLLAAVFNPGIIALDDYEFSIVKVIPAQVSTFESVISSSGIRSPIPNLFLLSLTHTALTVGLTDPFHQLAFALVILALITLAAFRFCARRLFEGDSDSAEKQTLALSLLLLYFTMPLLMSRPMFESMSAPFLCLSATFACLYWQKQSLRDLSFSLLFLAVASLLRFQVGICAFTLFGAVLGRKDKKGAAVFLGLGLLLFVFTGLLDWALRGEFHLSLRSYLAYNLSSSSVFGVQPFYVFIALFVALSLPPTFLSRFSGFDRKEAYRSLRPLLLFFIVFV